MVSVVLLIMIFFLIQNIIIFRKSKDSSNKKINFIALNSLILYFIQIPMIDLAFFGLKCVSIDEDQRLRQSISEKCWSQVHILMVLLIYIPNILFWAISLPRILANFEKKNASKKFDSSSFCWI